MRYLRVAIEICGDPVTGLWCPTCLLPSRIALVLRIGGSKMHVHSWCDGCGGRA